MNIFDQYGIKEVADVTLYSIHRKDDGSGDLYYVPALYLDTLKISTAEQTAENVWAEGGLGNSRLICWDYGKQINVNLEDALCTPASLGLCWGGVLGSDWKNAHITHDLGISHNDVNPVERLSRMEKAFYPKGNPKKSTISYLLPHCKEDKIDDNMGILLNSKVVDGTEVCGHGYVGNHSYGWKMQIESDIQSIAVVPDRFFDVTGRSYRINQNSQVWVNNNLGLDHKFNIIYDINPLYLDQKPPVANVIIDMTKDPDYQSLGIDLKRLDDIAENVTPSTHKPLANDTIPIDYAEKLYINVDDNNDYSAYIYGRKFAKIDTSGTVLGLKNLVNRLQDYPPVYNRLVEMTKYVTDYILTKSDNLDGVQKAVQELLAIASEYNDIIVSVDEKINVANELKAILYKGKEHTSQEEDNIKVRDIDIFDLAELRRLVGKILASTDKDTYKTDVEEILKAATEYVGHQKTIDEYNTTVTSKIQSIEGNGQPPKEPTTIVNDKFSVLEALKDIFLEKEANWYKPATPIMVEQFKHIDMWNRFSGINEMIYFLITKYEDNIRKIGVATITDNGSRYNYKKTEENDAPNENKLWAYVNPKTMMPYPDNYWFHQGEPYYVKSLTLAPQGKKLKSQKITITAGQFPGMYMMVGETYIRSRDTGEDERMQIKIPLCKVKSEQTLTLEAAGDPTTFSLSLEVARPRTGIMMELTTYETAVKQEVNENGILEIKDGSTEVLSD